jgi:ABC-2 type transport system ATP-binding protein
MSIRSQETSERSAPPGDVEAVIETHGLTKRFGERVAVNNVDLTVPRASAFGFVGPNGAGKTTLVRTILGLTRRASGTVRLLGYSMPEQHKLALARVGAIVEEPLFHLHLTGRENLQVVAAAREPQAHDRIAPALARVGLADRADERVRAYSMGMRQRLGVARCLLADPLLLILDEPMNGLDPAGIEEFREMINGLVGEGRTVFLSSHLLDEVQKTCDRVAIIDQGNILMQGLVEDIAGGRGQAIQFRCDSPDVAKDLLGAHHAVEQIQRTEDAIIVTIRTEPSTDTDTAVADMNRLLVEAGVSVFSIEAERVSLEERFLEITSRLEVTG